jgi:thioredoxin-like negative regulator of GroEL
MSQAMNFSPDVKILEGGEIPPNSVTLVYSPSCPHCHNILPQYNQLANLSGGKFSVNAVNLMDHYHTLRAGGIEVGGVPQILIRGGGSEILEYGGPRMAE